MVRILLAGDDFVANLAGDRSEHTVRAYRGDLTDLVEFLDDRGVHRWTDVGLADLRGWLGKMHRGGAAATTLQRRTAAVRVFYRWLVLDGLAATDVASALASPKVAQRLPPDLSGAHLEMMFRAAIDRAGDPSTGSLGVRDVALLEVLYGSGARVGEVCGLDIDDIDRARSTVRVLGKGNKERTVPLGGPAITAVDRWLSVRHEVAGPASGPAVFLGARGGRVDQRVVRRVVHDSLAAVPEAQATA